MVATDSSSAKLEMKIDKQCLQSIKDNAERISIVSQERITNELLKLKHLNSDLRK